MNDMTHMIEVWGDFACFSRPELSVERFSYPCPTPSAARGVFDAIYFKPQFYWQVKRIELLAPPAYIALRRNEVRDRTPSDRTIHSWMKGSVQAKPISADDSSQRQQRQTMALRSPRYRLTARIVPHRGFEHEETAYNEQFVRRASHGKCFQQPYLGCREFVAYFRHITDLEAERAATDYSQDLGLMLYDVFDLRRVNDSKARPFISLFNASIQNGILDVPPFDSEAVLKPEPSAGSNKRRAR